MSHYLIIIKKVKEIIERHLFQVPPEIKKKFSPILLESNVKSISLMSNSFFILIFINNEEFKRINELQKKGDNPFPGLIRPAEIQGVPAIVLENSRNIIIKSNIVDGFMFGPGKDSTAILLDHIQQIRTPRN